LKVENHDIVGLLQRWPMGFYERERPKKEEVFDEYDADAALEAFLRQPAQKRIMSELRSWSLNLYCHSRVRRPSRAAGAHPQFRPSERARVPNAMR